MVSKSSRSEAFDVSAIASQIAGLQADLAQQVERLRGEIARIKRERADVEAAPLSRIEAIARLDEWMGAYEVRPNVMAFVSRDPNRHYLVNGAGDIERAVDGALIAFLGERMRDRYIVEIDAELARLAKSVSAEEAAKRDADLAQRQWQLELEEERIICRAGEAGVTIARRREADPRAILEA